jgi:multidrug efflux pump subunit AcrB
MRRSKSKTQKQAKQKLSFLQKFSLFFFKNKRFSIFAWLTLLLAGLATYTTFIQREGFPSIEVPISVVNARYFVDDKAMVDAEVARPISSALADVSEIKEVATNSFDNFATILVTYKDEIGSEQGSQIVQKKLATLNLPAQANLDYQSINASKFANEFNLLVGVYSAESSHSVTETGKAAEGLAKKIAEQHGIESASVISQLKSAIDPSTGQSKEIQDSFDILGIKNEDQKIDYYETVNIGVKFKDGEDALEASDHVSEAISSYKSDNKLNGFDAKISADFAPIVRSQISSLQKNMLEGFLIIALISFVLVTWRAGLATALTMLTVLLTTVLILYLFGLTLNVISLFALILSLGLIVDDATIISEAIDSMKKHSKDRKEVVKEAIGRIGRASSAGTLTTILAFTPMLFISGILGGFIRAIPITIIISLALSLILSLSLIPFFASGFLLNKSDKDEKSNPVQKLEKYIARKLAKLIRYSGRNRKKGALISIGFILLSLVATMVGGTFFGKAGFDIFPKEKDSTELAIGVSYSPGSTIEDAQTQAAKVNEIITTEAGNIERLTYSGTGSTQSSSITLELTELEAREDTSVQIAERLNTSFAALKSQGLIANAASSGAAGPGSDYPLEIRVFTEEQAKAEKLISDIRVKFGETELKAVSGITYKVTKFMESDTSNLIQRVNGKDYFSLKIGFDSDSSTELIEGARLFVNENFNSSDYGLDKDAIQTDAGQEEGNQDSFKSMMIAFPIMLVAMYILLAFQFKSFLQPLFIFLAIPFSFLGVGAGLYYTNNSASFFVMLGFFALIGIALNNTILITDYANQERRKGAGRIDAIASALQARFRPLVTTSITGVVALIPLALQDPFWQSLSVTLIFGLLSSTLLVVLCFPYYLVASEVFRSLGRKIWRLVKHAFKHKS